MLIVGLILDINEAKEIEYIAKVFTVAQIARQISRTKT